MMSFFAIIASIVLKIFDFSLCKINYLQRDIVTKYFPTFLMILLFTFSNCHAVLLSNNADIWKKGARQRKLVDEMISEIHNSKYNDLSFAEKKAQNIINKASELNYNTGVFKASLELADILRLQNKNDTAFIVINELLKNEKFKKEIDASTYILLGVIQDANNQSDSALLSYQTAEGLLPQNESGKSRAILYSNRAAIESTRGQYQRAINNYLKAIEVLEKNDLEYFLVVNYTNIGQVFSEINQYDKAKVYLTKAVLLSGKIGNDYYLASAYTTLGSLYIQLDSLDLAIQFFDKALPLAEKVDDPTMVAIIKNNYGQVYVKTKEHDQALVFFQDALSLSRKIGFDVGVINALFYSGIIYKNKGDYTAAIANMEQALDVATHGNKFPRKKAEVYEQLANIYYLMEGNTKDKVYQFLQKYYALKDSVLGEKVRQNILELEKKYETEKKKRDILLLQKKRLQLLFFLFLVLLVAFVLLILFLRYRYLQMVSERDKQREKEKSNHLAEIIEVKNRELVTQASQLIKIQERGNQIINEITQTIDRYEQADSNLSTKIRFIVKKVAFQTNVFNEFEKRLEENNETFYKTLLDHFPNLSSTELKVCTFLRMNLSTKEISQITNRSPRTIDHTRNRIRKKLGLNSDDGLSQFLMKIQ